MRLTYRERLDSFNPVSIHASVKDATFGSATKQGDLPVSIHASVKDATPSCTVTFSVQKFQSTHL